MTVAFSSTLGLTEPALQTKEAAAEAASQVLLALSVEGLFSQHEEARN